MGATCPSELAVPAAPQAGLNNGITGWQTLSPARRKQEVTDLKLCLPPQTRSRPGLPPSKTFVWR